MADRPLKPPNAADWKRAHELFVEAVALPESERTALLRDRARADPALRLEVESLLKFAANDDIAGRNFGHVVGDAAHELSWLLPIEQVGPYRLIEEIGHGGMGAVYLATRADDDFRQRVAIKLMRGIVGPDALRRFRAERRMLASLEHPYIARLIDGGATDTGMPYLAMEYVDGVPIDEYCNSRSLSVSERLDLFMRVCDAVVHAHHALIVHRDLKPSNILVTADGTPKLLDFGIAKLLDDDGTDALLATRASMRMMTPEYASPEQIRGEPITMATDVYSLGVILYELLTGARPHTFGSRAIHEIVAVISTHDAPKPSTVTTLSAARELRGDLDTVVLTALQRDLARRYPSVEAFADDLSRYRSGHPVSARAATWRYLTRRFLARHRLAAAATAVLLLMTAGFAVMLGLSARRAAHERDTAERVTAMLVDMFSASDPAQSRGGATSARELLDRAAARVAQSLSEQPEVRAQLLDALGSVYFALGAWEPAQQLFNDSIQARGEAGESESLRTAMTRHRLADLLLWRGEAAAAEQLIASALTTRRRLLKEPHADIAASTALQARAALALGRPWPEVEALYLRAIDSWRQTLGAGTTEVAVALVQIARSRSAEGDFAGAEAAVREALGIRRAAFGDDHPLTVEAQVTLAQTVDQSGRSAESEPISREVLAHRRRIYGNDDHPWVHQAINQLALVLHGQGKLDEAEVHARRAAERARTMVGYHGGTASNIRTLGMILEDQGRLSEAAAAYRDALDVARKSPGAEPQTATILLSVAQLELLIGRPATALAAVDEAMAIQSKRIPRRHLTSVPATTARAAALAGLGRLDEAEALYQDALSIQRPVLPPRHPLLIATMTAYGVFLLDRGRTAEAESMLRDAHQAQEGSLPPAQWQRGWIATAYGAVLSATRGHAAGASLLQDGVSMLQAAFPAGDPRVRRAMRWARME
jgi:serine/threonine protein kinase